MIVYPQNLITKVNQKVFSSFEEGQKFLENLNKKAQNDIDSKKKKNFYEKIEQNPEDNGNFLQAKVLYWFSKLKLQEKKNICTIYNKWLKEIFSQMYSLYQKDNRIRFSVTNELFELFIEEAYSLHSYDLLNISKSASNDVVNSSNNMESKEYDSNLDEKENEGDFLYKKYFVYDSKVEPKEKTTDLDNEFLQNIKFISSDDNIIMISDELLSNFQQFKKMFLAFSEDSCFKSWLLPYYKNNVMNIHIPTWMRQSKNNFTLCQIIIGFFEINILLHYEYNFYTNGFYKFSYYNVLEKLDEENNEIKNKLNIKNFYFDNLFNEKILEEQIDKNKNDKELSLIIYNELKYHIQNIDDEKYKFLKLIEHLTFLGFTEIINNRKNIYFSYKEYIIQVMQDEKGILNEEIKNKIENKKSEKKKNANKKKKNKIKELRSNLLNKTYTAMNSDDSLARIISTNSLSTYKSSNCQEEQLSNFNEEDNKSICPEDIQNLNQNNDDVSDHFDINNNISNTNKDPITNVDNIIIEEFPLDNLNEKITINKNPSSNLDNNNITINNTPSLSLDTHKIKIKEAAGNLDNDTIKINDSPSFSLNSNNIKTNGTSSNLNDKNAIINETLSLPVVDNNNIKRKEISAIVENNNSIINDTPSLPLDNINDKKNKETPSNIDNIAEIKETPSVPIDNSKTKNEITSSKLNNKNIHSNTSSLSLENNNNNNIIKTPPLFPSDKQKNINQILLSRINEKIKEDNKNQCNFNQVCFLPCFFVNNNFNNNINGPALFSYNGYNNNMPFMPVNNICYNNFNYICNNNFINNNFYNLNNNNDFLKYFMFYKCLDENIKNYCSITKNNVTILNKYKQKYLLKVAKIICDNLKDKFEIQYGVYGSFNVNLSIEGSDIDVCIIYKQLTKQDTDFKTMLYSLLRDNEQKQDFRYNTTNILNARKPRIIVEIDISEEIFKNPELKVLNYCDESDFTKIKIDFTLSDNQQYLIDNMNSVDYVKKNLKEYPQLRDLNLVLKRYLRIIEKNELYEGGISSSSLFLMELNTIKTYLKENANKYIKVSELLVLFFQRFSSFNFSIYGIGKDNYNYAVQFNNEHAIQYILNPLNGENIAFNGKLYGPGINYIFKVGRNIIDSLFDKFDYKDIIYLFFLHAKTKKGIIKDYLTYLINIANTSK